MNYCGVIFYVVGPAVGEVTVLLQYALCTIVMLQNNLFNSLR